MAYVITSSEYVEIDGVPLNTPAWTTTQMDDLWSSPDVRGGDLLIPGAAGVRPHRRRPTVSQATIELAVVGDLAPDGTTYASTRVGLATNCDLLRTLTGTSGVALDGTREAVLHMAPGSPVELRSGRVHVLRLRIARDGDNLAVCQLELSIPAGGADVNQFYDVAVDALLRGELDLQDDPLVIAPYPFFYFNASHSTTADLGTSARAAAEPLENRDVSSGTLYADNVLFGPIGNGTIERLVVSRSSDDLLVLYLDTRPDRMPLYVRTNGGPIEIVWNERAVMTL